MPAAPLMGAAELIGVSASSSRPTTLSSLRAQTMSAASWGRFVFFWNDTGENRLELDLYDTISVPPGVCRGFTNISDEEGLLQVIISGGVHDMNDIDFATVCGEKIDAIRPGLRRELEKTGLTFTAGKDG